MLGLLWGLSLLPKVNGVFLIVPLVAWGVATRSLKPRQIPWLVGPGLLSFLAGGPWLWQDTLHRLHGFFLRQTVRWHVPAYYLGEVFDKGYPPWHYPLVMTAATMPPAVLAAALFGGWSVRRKPGGRGWLGLHVAFTLGLACLPGVPRYDGVRLFLPAFPFLAILAGLGMDLLLRPLRKPLAAGLLVLLVVPTVARFRELDPCLLSYYSPVVGGLQGAERLGLETSFWGDAITPEAMARVREAAPKRISVAPMADDYFRFLRLIGELPEGTEWARREEADMLLVVGRRSMLSRALRRRFETEPGWLEVRREGVALAKVYRQSPMLPPSVD